MPSQEEWDVFLTLAFRLYSAANTIKRDAHHWSGPYVEIDMNDYGALCEAVAAMRNAIEYHTNTEMGSE